MNNRVKDGAKAVGLVLFGTIVLGYKYYRNMFLGNRYLDKNLPKMKETKKKLIIKQEEDGYYSIQKKDNSEFRILQLTDIHIGGGYLSRHEDMTALNIIRRVVKTANPDLIVITGDLNCPDMSQSMTRNNLHSMSIITDMIESSKIPYAVAFGNHDATPKSTHTKKELADYLLGQRHCVMNLNEDTQNITGTSNYIVKLRNSDGSINSVIFVMDSNEYVKNGRKKQYDTIRDDQVEWYKKQTLRINKEENRNVPSYIYFHMPVQEYEEAWNHSVDGIGDTKFFFGDRDEEISKTAKPSKLFETAKELGCTKGLFCGHDHLNDFSIEYKGIRLTYGQSIDCLLYAKNLSGHKGGTLLNIDRDGKFTVKPIKQS